MTLVPSVLVSNDELHRAIAAADPLGALAANRRLHELNQAGDAYGIVALLTSVVHACDVASYSYVEAAAAMRDIGFFLGSLKRHGYEPLTHVPQLEPLLLRLAVTTSLPPRETLLHVTVWNPSGALERSYTGTGVERHLLESVRISMSALEAALAEIARLAEQPLEAPDFVERCARITGHLAKMVESVVYAYRNISPHAFITQLRPFYDPIQVAGRSYLGPGAVEMPLFVFEHVLWGSCVAHPEYTEFKETYLPYVLAPYRSLYATHVGRPSLIDRACRKLSESHGVSAELARARRALDTMFDCLLRFRAPHVRLAEKAYIDANESGQEVGSGGYAPAMLNTLLRLTHEARARLWQAAPDQTEPRDFAML